MGPKLSKSWWLTDTYDQEVSVPQEFYDYAGPKGLALVKAWPSGQTSDGWGLVGHNGGLGFMPRYMQDEFNPRRVLYGYDRGKWSFAFVMRSVNLIAIDIDGKNGGIEHASELLGNAGPTLAETSKSGNGYHLIYSLSEKWDKDVGFGELGDAIGIVQGVDIRVVGCLYHHPQQRWNTRSVAPLPKHIEEKLRNRAQARAAAAARIHITEEMDPMEIAMLHDELETELAKPVKAGKRNVTIFAVGLKMRTAEVPNWESKLAARANQIGLDDLEAEKIIRNINAQPIAP